MGLNIVFGIDTTTAAAISGILGILLFASPKWVVYLDNTAKILGTVMLVLIGYVAFSTNPPVAEAATHAVAPTHYPWLCNYYPYRWYRRWLHYILWRSPPH